MIDPHDAASSPKPRSLLASAARAARNLAICLLAFAACCAVLGAILPFPQVPVVTAKREYLKAHLSEYDTLFIGSSRFVHQIIPAQFDASLAAAGTPVRSFNLGVDGMWPPESLYFLRQILALHPPRLKWVVIELLETRPFVEQANSARAVYWHTTPVTFSLVQNILSMRRPWTFKWEKLRPHLWAWLQRSCNYGCGADWVTAQTQRSKSEQPFWFTNSGYWAEPDEPIKEGELKQLTANLESIRQQLPSYPMRPAFREEFLDCIAAVRRAGAEPVFILSPTVNKFENVRDIPEGAPVLRFNNPAEYPQLYEPEIYYDSVHLNRAGASLYTDLLAERFLESVVKVQPASRNQNASR